MTPRPIEVVDLVLKDGKNVTVDMVFVLDVILRDGRRVIASSQKVLSVNPST